MNKWNKLVYSVFAVTCFNFIFVSPVFACSDVSGDGCPTIEEVDDNASSVAIVGSWLNSTAKLLWYGDKYLVTPGGGASETASATFFSTVDTEVAGDYSVYARWTTASNRCTTTRFEVYDGATLITTVLRDQTQNGGAWIRLGTYEFSANQVPRVKVSNLNCPANKWVVADGVRWVKEDNNRNSIRDEPGVEFAESTTTVTLSGTDTNYLTVTLTAPEDGYIIVNASGYWTLSPTTEIARCSISTTSATLDFGALMLAGNGAQYATFSGTRVFTVAEGSHTYYLVCDASTGAPTLGRPKLNALYVPTRY